MEGSTEMYYLMMHSVHFIYGNIVSDHQECCQLHFVKPNYKQVLTIWQQNFPPNNK